MNTPFGIHAELVKSSLGGLPARLSGPIHDEAPFAPLVPRSPSQHECGVDKGQTSASAGPPRPKRGPCLFSGHRSAWVADPALAPIPHPTSRSFLSDGMSAR